MIRAARPCSAETNAIMFLLLSRSDGVLRRRSLRQTAALARRAPVRVAACAAACVLHKVVPCLRWHLDVANGSEAYVTAGPGRRRIVSDREAIRCIRRLTTVVYLPNLRSWSIADLASQRIMAASRFDCVAVSKAALRMAGYNPPAGRFTTPLGLFLWAGTQDGATSRTLGGLHG